MKAGGTYDVISYTNVGDGMMTEKYTGNWTLTDPKKCETILTVAGQSTKIAAFLAKDKNEVDGSGFNDNQAFAFKMERAAEMCTAASLPAATQYSGLFFMKNVPVGYSGQDWYGPNGKFTARGYFSTQGEVSLTGNYTISSDCVLTRKITGFSTYMGVLAKDKDVYYLNADKGIDGGVANPSW
jgi:hypothetical protein